jgi:outer membrane protein assembly factor BamB
MASLRCTMILLLGLAVAGCTGKKHLPRDGGMFEMVWPRSPYQQAAARESKAPFNGDLKLLYEKKVKGSAFTPILVGEKYLAFNTGRSRFLVLDRQTGRQVCRIRKGKGVIRQPVIVDSLLVLVKRVPLGRIQIINLFTGKTLMERTVNEIRSGPINVKNALIFGTTAGIAAFSLPDLQTVWSYESKGMVDAAPVTDGEKIYFVSGKHRAMAIGADNGSLIWIRETDADVVSELSLGRYLFCGLADGRVIAMDRQTGGKIWEQSLAYPIRGALTEADGKIYLGCNDGKIYCLAADDGTREWEYQTDGVVTAAPVVVGQAVVVGSYDRFLYSLDRVNGELLDRRRLQGSITQSVAVDGGRMFAVCEKNRVYCFEVD